MIPFLTPALVKAAAVVAGVALLAGGAAGASAAFGGPNVADEVLTTVGITSDHGPNENANANASERCDNAAQGRDNADDNAANAGDHPNARSSEGGANGQPNANANPRASDRCLNTPTREPATVALMPMLPATALMTPTRTPTPTPQRGPITPKTSRAMPMAQLTASLTTCQPIRYRRSRRFRIPRSQNLHRQISVDTHGGLKA